MNQSGSITISDFWLWCKWIYFYPGDLIVYYLMNGASSVGQFFDISYASYGGVLSNFVSFCCWLIIILTALGLGLERRN
jgi:hypothetical protein